MIDWTCSFSCDNCGKEETVDAMELCGSELSSVGVDDLPGGWVGDKDAQYCSEECAKEAGFEVE